MKRAIGAIRERIDDEDGLLKSGSIFLVGSVFCAILNYMFHLFMGRMLGPKDYGVLGSLFAIIYLVMFSTETFNRVISKYTSEFHGRNEKSFLKRLLKRAFLKGSVAGAAFFLIYLALSPLIADFMKINNISSVILVGFIAYLSILTAISLGALNGLQKFVWQNISASVSILLKFSLAIILVYLGFGVNGALIAILIGIIAGIIIAIYPLKEALSGTESERFSSQKIYLYIIPVFLSSFFSMLLITFDQILVKHFFSSADAGYYAAAGMIAKIIWFGSGFFVGALFPKIVDYTAKGKDASRLLVKCLAYTAILLFLGISAYFIMPNFIVSTLFGNEYIVIAPMISVFGLAMGMFSLMQILAIYNLAVGKYGFIWIVALGFLIETTGIFLFHDAIFDVIKIFFGANLLILIGMVVYNKKELVRQIA